MFEVVFYLTAGRDGCQNNHVTFAMLTHSHIDFKDFSEHFAPARGFKRNILCCAKVRGHVAYYGVSFNERGYAYLSQMAQQTRWQEVLGWGQIQRLH